MKTSDPMRPFELDPAMLRPDELKMVTREEEQHHDIVLTPVTKESSRRRPWLKLLGGGATAFVIGLIGLDAYDFTVGLFDRSFWLGLVFSLFLGAAALGAFGIVGREVWSLRKLARVEDLRHEGERLMIAETHGRAESFLKKVERLYKDRPELDAALFAFHEQASDALNDKERIELFAALAFKDLDRAAYQMVQRSGRDIAVLTAITPISAIDSLIVMVRTVAMMRAIARLYGVRPGFAATMRLARQAVRNIVIAGVGDIMSHAALEAAGASLIRIISARAGQGAINGLLAARVGLSVMQICRPIPFREQDLPSLRRLRREIFNELGAPER